MTRTSVLVVDDKQAVTELMVTILRDAYDVTGTCDAGEAMALLDRREFAVVLTDVRMPGASGFDVLAAVRRRGVATRVVLMTAFASVPDAVRAIREGAFDYVAKPLDAPEVQLVVARAAEERVLGPRPAPLAAPVDVKFHEAVLAARHRASREYLVSLMKRCSGNVTRAARQAGMARESLHRVLKQYGVRSEEFKPPEA